ncbi:MAG: hypothetical protein ACTS44_01195 [Candidatus Hodgkinia cicadicola]
MNGSRGKSYHGYVWIPKARSTRKSEGIFRIRNGPSEVNLLTKILEEGSAVGGDNINKRLMKINVRRN